MRFEYFQLIDRIVEINLADRLISSEAIVPTESTIFEGHFPGYPLMPGVLLIECMAQDPEQLRGYLNLIFISRCLERVGDHATNIAEDAVYAAAAEDIRHQPFVAPA